MPPPIPTELREADLVTSAGAIDRLMLVRIAAHRARRELGAYAAMATPRPWAELLEEELRRTWSIARIMRDCAAGRRVVTAMAPAEQRIRRTEAASPATSPRPRDPVMRQDRGRHRPCRGAAGADTRRPARRNRRSCGIGAQHVPSPQSSAPHHRAIGQPVIGPQACQRASSTRARWADPHDRRSGGCRALRLDSARAVPDARSASLEPGEVLRGVGRGARPRRICASTKSNDAQPRARGAHLALARRQDRAAARRLDRECLVESRSYDEPAGQTDGGRLAAAAGMLRTSFGEDTPIDT
jgi:hypothetical protein